MKLPSKVTVGPLDYTIVTKDQPDINDNPCLGYHDFKQAEICIKRKINPQVQAHCLLHECLHAMWDCAELNFEKEEEIITRLTPVLRKFIKENPKVVEYLQS